MPEDTFLIGYADDIAAVITARNTIEAQKRLTQVMIRTQTWLSSRGLELATHKTELLLFTGKQIPTEIEMRVSGNLIRTQRTVNYLGVRLDSKLTFWEQLKYATRKTATATGSLSRLMANVDGPTAGKRRLLMEATNAILLYGSEVWADTLEANVRRKPMLAVQRRAALRITSAYRTVSGAAVTVIAAVIP
ncbi:uncharacterized protein Dmoj_GI25882, partial [Drosophila mojavensis]